MVQVATAWLALELAPRGLEGLAIDLPLGVYVVSEIVASLPPWLLTDGADSTAHRLSIDLR